MSSDSRADEWVDACPLYLPKGYPQPNVLDFEEYAKTQFNDTYEGGQPKFKVYYNGGWHVEKICPCGLLVCEKHIIPSETLYEGSVSMAPLFMKLDVMTTEEARAWWSKYPGRTTIRAGRIQRTVMVPWPYTFPEGHELKGLVDEMKADELVRAHFKEGYEIDGTTIYQVCPCGKRACPEHVIPSTVKITASFPLEMHIHTRKRGRKGKRKKIPPVEFGKDFRKQKAMSLAKAQLWFQEVGLRCTVDVKPDEITLKMICHCGKSLERTPCAACHESELKACDECGEKYKKRMLKKYEGKKICGNCRRKKVSYCDICKQDAPLDHPCLPLVNQHFSGRINEVYPPCIRVKSSKDVICPDCKKGMNYNIYARHQQRRHSDLKACSRYTRAYEVHFCHYCDYSNCDKTNVTEHELFHYLEKIHKCLYCDQRFSRASSRAIHHQAVHREFSGHQAFQVVRRGGTVVRERRRGTIQYLD
jgi:hypothetical protein